MTPQELKNSILQLAIQGKLVEQRPEEGTAEELYKQIQAEKQARIKAGKIKKEKPLPEIAEDEVPFEIPESWMWVRFGNTISLLSGTDFKPEEYNDQTKGIPYITGASSLSETGVLVNRWTESPRVIAEYGDILLVCKGSGYGKTVICDIDKAHIARQIMAIKKFKSIDMLFLIVFLKANLRQIKANGQGVIPGIDRGSVMSMCFPLPPLAEQKRIVAKIEELLPLIERYEKAWSRLEDFNKRFPVDMQKSILQMAIQGKLVEQRPEEGTGEELYKQIQAEKQALIKAGKIKIEKPLLEIAEDEIPFEIPESWKWVRFSELMLSMSTGPFGSMLHKADYIENGIPLVNPANIVNGAIIPSSKMMVSEETRTRLNSYILHSGMIVMGRRGEMGRCAVITEKEDGWLCGTGSFFMVPAVCLLVEYLSRFFSTPYAKQYLGGESIGTTMSNLNHTFLSRIPVPLPPLAEQKRIVARLKELLPLCERLK